MKSPLGDLGARLLTYLLLTQDILQVVQGLFGQVGPVVVEIIRDFHPVLEIDWPAVRSVILPAQ